MDVKISNEAGLCVGLLQIMWVYYTQIRLKRLQQDSSEAASLMGPGVSGYADSYSPSDLKRLLFLISPCQKALLLHATSPSVVTAHAQTCRGGKLHCVRSLCSAFLLSFTMKLCRSLWTHDNASPSLIIKELPEFEPGRQITFSFFCCWKKFPHWKWSTQTAWSRKEREGKKKKSEAEPSSARGAERQRFPFEDWVVIVLSENTHLWHFVSCGSVSSCSCVEFPPPQHRLRDLSHKDGLFI